MVESEFKDFAGFAHVKLRKWIDRWRRLPKWSKVMKLNKYNLILSAFLSLSISRIGYYGKLSLNLFSLLVHLVKHGFPFGIFLILLLCFEPFILVFTLRKDEFGIRDPSRDFSISKKGTYGTAEQLTEAQLREKKIAIISPVEDAYGPIFGQFGENASKVITFDVFNSDAMMNRHILAFGASMCGKTFCFVLPHLLQICKREESVIMSDPKGELFQNTSEYFRSYGYTVKVLNFKDFAYSDGWDIMAELGDRSDVAHVQERAQIFAETVIANTMPNTTDMFRSAPLSLLKAILLRVYLDPTMEHSFEEVFRAISNPQGKTFLDRIFDESVLTGDLSCCIGPYATYKQQSANLSGNTLSGLATALNVFQVERIRKLTSTAGIDLSLPGKQKCAYYLIFPDQHETYKFLTSLLFSFLFIDLVDYADKQPKQCCDVTVNCIFEEAKSVGFIPGFATKLSNIRSRHVYITSIWQDLSQMQLLYPDEWGSIMNNCSTQICLGFNDVDTAKYYSDRSGQATIMVDTERHEGFETVAKLFVPHNLGEGNRTVFTMDELIRAPKDVCFVFFQRENALCCRKFPVTLHPDYEQMSAHPVQPADVIPNIDDEKAREKYDAECKRRVEEYEKMRTEGKAPRHGDGHKQNHDTTKTNEDTSFADFLSQKAWKYQTEQAVKRAKKYSQSSSWRYEPPCKDDFQGVYEEPSEDEWEVDPNAAEQFTYDQKPNEPNPVDRFYKQEQPQEDLYDDASLDDIMDFYAENTPDTGDTADQKEESSPSTRSSQQPQKQEQATSNDNVSANSSGAINNQKQETSHQDVQMEKTAQNTIETPKNKAGTHDSENVSPEYVESEKAYTGRNKANTRESLSPEDKASELQKGKKRKRKIRKTASYQNADSMQKLFSDDHFGSNDDLEE